MTDSTHAASPHVFDATAASFEANVIHASLETPVLVDFWATWCGPCKTLGPILEKLASEYGGAFRLAKIDVDKEQQLAAAFQIRSVPTVMLVKGGQLVDGFPGALPEGELRQFLASHGIEPAAHAEDADAAPAPPADPHAEVLRLRKLHADYDPTDRVAAMSYMHARAAEGELVTGLLYLEGEAGDLHAAQHTSARPLNALGKADLCPGAAALEQINARLR